MSLEPSLDFKLITKDFTEVADQDRESQHEASNFPFLVSSAQILSLCFLFVAS